MQLDLAKVQCWIGRFELNIELERNHPAAQHVTAASRLPAAAVPSATEVLGTLLRAKQARTVEPVES